MDPGVKGRGQGSPAAPSSRLRGGGRAGLRVVLGRPACLHRAFRSRVEAMDKKRKMVFIQRESFAPWQGTRQLLKFSRCCYGLGFLFKQTRAMTNARGGRARGEAEKGFHFCKPGKINEICKGSLISLYNVKKKCSFNRYHLIPLLRQSIADRSQEAPWVLQQRQKDQEYNEEAESSSSPSSS